MIHDIFHIWTSISIMKQLNLRTSLQEHDVDFEFLTTALINYKIVIDWKHLFSVQKYIANNVNLISIVYKFYNLY